MEAWQQTSWLVGLLALTQGLQLRFTFEVPVVGMELWPQGLSVGSTFEVPVVGMGL